MIRAIRHHRAMFVLLLLLCAALLHAEVVVVYVEGLCETDSGENRAELMIGDPLSPDAVVRVARGGYLELQTTSGIVRLTREGTYRLADLIGTNTRARSSGARSFFSNRVGTLLGTVRVVQPAVVSGVRGTPLERSEAPSDARDAVILREASGLLSDGNLEEGFAHLESGHAEMEDARFLPHYAFLLGVASYGLGDPAAALEWLAEPGPDPESDFYYEHALLLAQVLVESYRFGDALAVLDDLQIWYAGAERDSDFLLLTGIACLESGDDVRAADYLARVTEEPALSVAASLLAGMSE